MRIPHNEPLGSAKSGQRGGGSDTPERRCVLTGHHAGRDELLRLAVSPDGLVLPDVHARAPGRGAWLGVTKAELVAATAKGKLKAALARAFKDSQLTIPDDLADRAEAARWQGAAGVRQDRQRCPQRQGRRAVSRRRCQQ